MLSHGCSVTALGRLARCGLAIIDRVREPGRRGTPAIARLRISEAGRRLEDTALWIDERDALAVEHEARLRLSGGQEIMGIDEPPHVLESRQAQCRVMVAVSGTSVR
jgi:hypothetical protein